jgi:hypothetical protein
MEIVEQLKKAGVPIPLIKWTMQGKLDKPFRSKAMMAKEVLLAGDKRVVLTIGCDSPQKDQFCVALMREYMLGNNKTGRWLMPPQKGLYDDDIGNDGITVVVAVDLLSPLAARQVAGALREKIEHGRRFILCANNKGALADTLGQPIMLYLEHRAIIVNVDVPRGQMTEV